MKVPFINTDDLETLKLSIPQTREDYLLPSNDWINETSGHDIFRKTGEEMPETDLDMSADKPDQTDFENVKRVYGGLRRLSDSKASDERIWSALALGPFYNYVQYRWLSRKDADKISDGTIKEKFFKSGGGRRSLLRNAISRLWWIGRLTYDEKRKDPWELTEFICRHSDYIFHILERNTSNNPQIVREFVSALKDGEQMGLKVNTDMVGELSKYLQILGGVSVLDLLPEGVIREKILKKLIELNKNKNDKH